MREPRRVHPLLSGASMTRLEKQSEDRVVFCHDDLCEQLCVDTAAAGWTGLFDPRETNGLGAAPHRLTPAACLAGEN